jgi:hypothetical protein
MRPAGSSRSLPTSTPSRLHNEGMHLSPASGRKWGATHSSYPTSLATLFDGVAFFQTTTAARALPLGDCPDQIYR